MKFKVTTLCENNIGHGSQNLMGEHGLSFFVEADDRCILFDTGQNLGLVNNARVLGIDEQIREGKRNKEMGDRKTQARC